MIWYHIGNLVVWAFALGFIPTLILLYRVWKIKSVTVNDLLSPPSEERVREIQFGLRNPDVLRYGKIDRRDLL
jgi:hypothetical protein